MELGKRTKHVLIISTPYTLKLVEDAIVLVKVAEFTPQVIVDWDRLHWL